MTQLSEFEAFLIQEEKSAATQQKYLRDVRAYLTFLCGEPPSKQKTIAYKEAIMQRYSPRSVNSMLVSVNAFLKFTDRFDCTVRSLRIQQSLISGEEKELTRSEYERLIAAAKDKRIGYILQTICSTGIRVSELQFITVQAVESGKAVINNKGKIRVILLPKRLQAFLKKYIKKSGVMTGSVFVSKNGIPLDRSNIWREMKKLCAEANVRTEKVFPHNLRHLFARCFMSVEKNVVYLADILGHSDVNTTRIYTRVQDAVLAGKINKMELVLSTT